MLFRVDGFASTAPVSGVACAALFTVGRASQATPLAGIAAVDAALLGWSAPVMRQRRHVLDAGDLQPVVLELDDRLLAAGAGAFHLHLDLDHAVLARFDGRLLGGAAGGPGGALAGALDAGDRARR